MKTTNYYDTFIEVADDCPVSAGTIPPTKKKKSIAQYQYEMLIDNPYVYTSDDVFFAVFSQRNEIPEHEKAAAREAFFSRDQPCFRASPLTKSYGWGVHSDSNGKIALVDSGSEEYKRLASDPSLVHKKAMKSKK